MKKLNPKKARSHLEKLRQLIAARRSPFSHMSEEEAIKEIRKTRERLWNEKLAASTNPL